MYFRIHRHPLVELFFFSSPWHLQPREQRHSHCLFLFHLPIFCLQSRLFKPSSRQWRTKPLIFVWCYWSITLIPDLSLSFSPVLVCNVCCTRTLHSVAPSTGLRASSEGCTFVAIFIKRLGQRGSSYWSHLQLMEEYERPSLGMCLERMRGFDFPVIEFFSFSVSFWCFPEAKALESWLPFASLCGQSRSISLQLYRPKLQESKNWILRIPVSLQCLPCVCIDTVAMPFR